MAILNSPKRRYHITNRLTGDELFPFETGTEAENRILARDLKVYLGGDIAAPSIRPERGAHSVRISHFPNAGGQMDDAGLVTGLRNGLNVNFTLRQMRPAGASGSFVSQDGKTITVVDGIITGID